ncbi:tetratricopeptide repeat protein [Acetivibrio straminisolvens]|jgi:tetratricopeptide (TPR) repeat protein|uniref:TPR repeat protein n=1 Tax=Acetivibrio straminisolvens JCM 21531 TaxID=1294263 RepID=W4VD55_9FIRM|nr:tetratricopeptide repeat protein [Acetivibrio straminisolvens]GAE90689.1 TPR repeat protein [Acetivibrio straminisolvens JCM 21531]
MNVNVKDIIADSHLAFLNQENETALRLAKQAILLAPDNPDAYKCAGNACMSLDRYDEAIEYYSMAVKSDPRNGNRYYDIGFALASAEKFSDALKNLAKAEELGCSPENFVQLYNLLGILCFDIGRYDDALVNLSKAEQLIGIDVDILKRKAIIYGIKNDIRNGLMTANQIKLVAPSEYTGYQIAFKLLVQAKRLDDAQKELERAQKYAVPTMDFYFDCMTLELEKYKIDNDKKHFETALGIIEEALKTVKPTVKEVIESYINAAEIYLQLEDADRTIECLNAAQNPVWAYNNGFDVIVKTFEPVTLTEYDVEDMIEADRQKIEERFGDYGFEEMVESIEPDEEGNRDYLTVIEDELQNDVQDDTVVYKLDKSEKVEYSSDNVDQINRLYVGAYTVKKDFNKVIEYARKLQTSENTYSIYMGKYAEANAMKELRLPDFTSKYEEVIKFFRNAMIKDPTDLTAVTFRVQCYIDIGRYDEAEQLCGLLTKEVRDSLMEKIKEAKSGGE